MIEKLKIEHTRLKKEIAADKDGIEDYEGAKGLLPRKIEDCEVAKMTDPHCIRHLLAW